MSEIETLAKGLTQAQRVTLKFRKEPSGAGKWPLKNALVGKGLYTTHPWTITPLGIQVRDYLEGQS